MILSEKFYQLKETESGHLTAIQNGISLHCLENPLLEAKKYIETLPFKKGEKKVLVFGVGLGYHLREIFLKYKNQGTQDFLIMAIGPKDESFRDYLSLYYERSLHLKLLVSNSPEEIFFNKEFVDFYLSDPLICLWRPCLLAQKNFFEKVMSYKALRKKTYSSSLEKILEELKKKEWEL